jgi:hypothetical protein
LGLPEGLVPSNIQCYGASAILFEWHPDVTSFA